MPQFSLIANINRTTSQWANLFLHKAMLQWINQPLESLTRSLLRRELITKRDLSKRVLVIASRFNLGNHSSKRGPLEMEARLRGQRTLSSSRQMATISLQNLSRFQAQFFLTRKLISLLIFVLLMHQATIMHSLDSALQMAAALDRKCGVTSL